MTTDYEEQIISKLTKGITQNIHKDRTASEFMFEVVRLCLEILRKTSNHKHKESKQIQINATVWRVFNRIIRLLDATNLLRLAGFEDLCSLPLRSAYEYALDLKKMAKDHTNYQLIMCWNVLSIIKTISDFEKAGRNPEVNEGVKENINSSKKKLHEAHDSFMVEWELDPEILIEHWCISKRTLEKKRVLNIAEDVDEEESYRILYSHLSAQCHPNPLNTVKQQDVDSATIVTAIPKILEMSLNSYLKWHPQLALYCDKLEEIVCKHYPQFKAV